ncbi:MAG: hypothetical protein HC828_03685 [Blastochloris sp.]|nr:hypothetical protein [Blastochloris sp.]
MQETWAGSVEISIDGESRGIFNLYQPTPGLRTISFGDLSAGAHVVHVRAYRGRATIDRFVTPGAAPFFAPVVPAGVSRLEENHPTVRFNNAPLATTSTAWTVFTNGRLSEGYGVWSKTANTTVMVDFDGPWIGFGFLTTTNAGKVDVAIDGVYRETLDLYRSSEAPLSVYYDDLSAGAHTLTLTVLGQKNPSATDSRIYLDYIDIWDGTTPAGGIFEHNTPPVARTSNWVYVNEAQASDGSYLRSGSSVWVPFVGDSVTYQGWSNGGTAELYVDGHSARRSACNRALPDSKPGR